MRILANVPLDVPVQQLDGRVERVISAVLISLRDEESHNFGEKAAIIPHITTGDVVSNASSSIAEDLPEDFFPGLWSRSWELVESHVFSWSRFFKAAGVGTFVAITDSNVY